MSKYGVISGSYFLVFELNTERYFVYLRIQSECGKIRTRNNPVFGHFSRSEQFRGVPKNNCFVKILKNRRSRLEVICKKGFLKNFANFTGKHLRARASFLIKLQASAIDTLAQVFSCKFCKIFKHNFF